MPRFLVEWEWLSFTFYSREPRSDDTSSRDVTDNTNVHLSLTPERKQTPAEKTMHNNAQMKHQDGKVCLLEKISNVPCNMFLCLLKDVNYASHLSLLCVKFTVKSPFSFGSQSHSLKTSSVFVQQ